MASPVLWASAPCAICYQRPAGSVLAVCYQAPVLPSLALALILLAAAAAAALVHPCLLNCPMPPTPAQGVFVPSRMEVQMRDGSFVSGTEFERLAGRGAAKKWKVRGWAGRPSQALEALTLASPTVTLENRACPQKQRRLLFSLELKSALHWCLSFVWYQLFAGMCPRP